MPWSVENPPNSIKNKSKGAIAAGVAAANSALERGLSEQDAIFAAIAAANSWEKKNSVQKAIIQKPELPSHIRAILEAKKLKEETASIEKQEEIKEPRIKKAFLGKNAIESDSTRSLVNVQWDKKGRLILTFDDGEQIITDPVPVSENIEQHISVSSKTELSSLTDVLLEDLQDKDILYFDALDNIWKNRTADSFFFDGGSASSIYRESDVINGGSASG